MSTWARRQSRGLAAKPIIDIDLVVVLAQAWRGDPQHQISCVLKSSDIVPDDQHMAAPRESPAPPRAPPTSWTRRHRHRLRHQAPIVTSDPGDLTHIADAIGVKIRLYTI